MKQRNKGFSLIELLAVIVVLSLIMLITTPIVINIVEIARKGAFKNTAYGIIKSTELNIGSNIINNKFRSLTFTYENGNETSSPEGFELNYKGTRPKSGKVIVNNKGEIGVSLYNGKWCAVKNFAEAEVIIYDINMEDCLQSVALATIELIGNQTEYVEVNTIYVEEGVIAKTIDGDTIENIQFEIKYGSELVDNVDVSKLGTYLITYISEHEGYKAKISRTVIVRDTISPNLTIPSNVTLKVEEVLNYDFMNGVEVSDNSLEEIVVTLSGNVASLPGDYTVTYSAQDSSGNKVEKTRYITVIDVGYPEITILGNNPTSINVGASYVDAGATAIDDVDGNITSRIVTTGTVNVNIPGTYIITYTVSDNANNKTSVTRTVNVIDNVPPTVTFGTNGNSTYAKTRSTTVTVSDAHSNINASSLKYLWSTSTATPSEGSFISTFTNGGTISSSSGVTGSYYLWILAKDAVGNTRIQRSNVFNLDNTVPVITISGNLVIEITAGTPYIDPGATASDNIDGNITSKITVTGIVNINVPGTYTITYNVTDIAGNKAVSKSRTVKVNPSYFSNNLAASEELYENPVWQARRAFKINSNGTVTLYQTSVRVDGAVDGYRTTPLSNIKSIAAEMSYLYTASNDGTVRRIQCGYDRSDCTLPGTQLTGFSNVISLSATSEIYEDPVWQARRVYGLKADGTVSYYQTSVRVDGAADGYRSMALTNIKAIAAETGNLYAARADGSVVKVSCWYDTTNCTSTGTVMTGFTNVIALAAAGVVYENPVWQARAIYALKKDGTVRLYHTTVRVDGAIDGYKDLPLTGIVAIAAETNVLYALRNDGKVIQYSCDYRSATCTGSGTVMTGFSS